ncbi:patatin-like phospholipase family protein [Aquabacterium lacunae]|nr:patatin-like phospholipase family protein [Aquabacterium lacunae]
MNSTPASGVGYGALTWGRRVMVWLVVAASVPLCAQPSPATPVTPQGAAATEPLRPKVGLVLSGGGARGLTHVGVLKVLERERIPVDVIAGTSMGAIVGGLYASGMDAAQVEREVQQLDWDNVFASRVERREISQRRKEQDFEVSPLFEVGIGTDGLKAPLGPVSSRGLEAHLRRLTLSTVQVDEFDRLPTPFRAVATDMETGAAVILRKGDLALALRSSMSVPGVFAPVEVDGRILGDGGLVNNTPVDVARSMGAQRLIVVNIGTPLFKREVLSTFTGVTAQMISILTEQNVQRSLASLQPDDVLIAPVLDGLTAADFNRARDFIQQGEVQAEALVLRMQDLKVSEAEYARWKQRRRVAQGEGDVIRAVTFEGTRATHPEQLQAQLETRAGTPFDVARAERDLRRLAATGDYLTTDYQLRRSDEGNTLVFRLQDKPWGPDYLQMGLDFNTDSAGRSAFNLKLVHNRHWLNAQGAEWRNFVRLGSAPSYATELYQPVSWLSPDGWRPFVALGGMVERRNVNLYQDPTEGVALNLSRRAQTAAAELGYAWRELGEVRAGWFDEVLRLNPELVDASWLGPRVPQRAHERGWRLRGVFDQLDSAYFPRQGWRVDGSVHHGWRTGDGLPDTSLGEMHRWDLTGQAVTSVGSHSFQFSGRLAGSGGALPDQPRYTLGGFQQLSGYAPGQLNGQQVALLRLGYAWRVGAYPLTRGLYLGASLEAGKAWREWSRHEQAPWRSGSSVYVGADTALGPVYFAVGSAQGVRPTVMLFVGRP